MAFCYTVKLLALDGTLIGAVINPSDVSLPQYATTTQWQIIIQGKRGDIITMAQAQNTFSDYTGSCPPVPANANDMAYLPAPLISIGFREADKSLHKIPPIYVQFPFLDKTILNKNPELFLFIYRRKLSRYKGDAIYPNSDESCAARKGVKDNQNRFVHPTHLDGSKYAGSPFFTGLQKSKTGQIIDFRFTEWDLKIHSAYEKQRLFINPYNWFAKDGVIGERFFEKNSGNPLNVSLNDKYLIDGNIKMVTGQYKKSKPTNTDGIGRNPSFRLTTKHSPKTLYFKLALAIDNPDYDPANPLKKYNIPKIIGNMSDTFGITLHKMYSDNDGGKNLFDCFTAKIFNGRQGLK